MMEQHFVLRKLKTDFTLILTLPGDDSPHPMRVCENGMSNFELNPQPLLLKREGALLFCFINPSLFKRGI
jgi:hypothetical protein